MEFIEKPLTIDELTCEYCGRVFKRTSLMKKHAPHCKYNPNRLPRPPAVRQGVIFSKAMMDAMAALEGWYGNRPTIIYLATHAYLAKHKSLDAYRMDYPLPKGPAVTVYFTLPAELRDTIHKLCLRTHVRMSELIRGMVAWFMNRKSSQAWVGVIEKMDEEVPLVEAPSWAEGWD